MTKASFAHEDVMEDYLGELLHDEPPAPATLAPLQTQALEKLLNSAPQIAEQAVPSLVEPALTPLSKSSRSEARRTPIEPNPSPVVAQQGTSGDPQGHIRTRDFQALFFKVGGLTLAVPLTELGGIHRLDKVGPLIGKPDWFKGIMLHRQQRLNVVDSAAWIMPEKYDQALAETLDYQYLIMLKDSLWGLTCETLVNTLTLSPEEVKWRTQTGKRPWLAGMVKDPMCALLNVPELIMLLNKGLGHKQA